MLPTTFDGPDADDCADYLSQVTSHHNGQSFWTNVPLGVYK